VIEAEDLCHLFNDIYILSLMHEYYDAAPASQWNGEAVPINVV